MSATRTGRPAAGARRSRAGVAPEGHCRQVAATTTDVTIDPSWTAKSRNTQRRARPSRQAPTGRTRRQRSRTAQPADRRLAVTQQQPGKPAPEVGAAELGRHPHSRRKQDRAAVRICAPSHPRHSENSAGNSERYATSTPRRHADRPGQPAELRHDGAGPVDGSAEIAEPGDESQEKARAAAERGRCRGSSNSATMSGVSAIHAKSG